MGLASFLKDGMFESSEALRVIERPPRVVFMFYLTSVLSYIFTFVKGGSFVDDLPLSSLSVVFMPLADPERHMVLWVLVKSWL